MKRKAALLLVAVILQPCATNLMAAPPVEEAKPTLTCWYNENGTSTGADAGEFSGGVRGEALRLRESGEYAWAYLIDREDGSSCPDTLPGIVVEEAPPVEASPVDEAKPPLTCWYNDKKASTGADVGNYAGRALGKAVRLRETGEEAWAYVISDWEDGSSCPDELPGAGGYN